MKAYKIIHNGESRIKVEFPQNQAIAALIRQIDDAKWSKTYKAWHIPYTIDAFNKLKSLFPEIEYPNKISSVKAEKHLAIPEVRLEPEVQAKFSAQIPTKVYIDVIGRQIIVKMPKNEIDIRLVSAIKYSRWDKTRFCWIIPNYPGISN